MKGVIINQYGSVEVLKYQVLEKPLVSADEVLIRVVASSVNPVDCKIRRGDLQPLSGFGRRSLASPARSPWSEFSSSNTHKSPSDGSRSRRGNRQDRAHRVNRGS